MRLLCFRPRFRDAVRSVTERDFVSGTRVYIFGFWKTLLSKQLMSLAATLRAGDGLLLR